MYQAGDIFLTRRADESENVSPGYWNHAAIYTEHGTIIESLRERGVVETNFENWLEDVDRFVTIRYNGVNKDKPKMAAKFARRLLGIRYRTISSIFRVIGSRRINMGLNCVSVVRLCYRKAFRYDPGWRIPDHIYEDKNFRRI